MEMGLNGWLRGLSSRKQLLGLLVTRTRLGDIGGRNAPASEHRQTEFRSRMTLIPHTTPANKVHRQWQASCRVLGVFSYLTFSQR